MAETFEIWCRSDNQAEWTLYGEFANECELRAEIPNIQSCGLYTKRAVVETNEIINAYVADNGQFGVGA